MDQDTYADDLTVAQAFYENDRSLPRAAASLRDTAKWMRQRADRLEQLADGLDSKVLDAQP